MRAKQRGINNKQGGQEPKCKKKPKRHAPKCIKPNTNLATFGSPQLGVLQNHVYIRKGFDRMLCTDGDASAGRPKPATTTPHRVLPKTSAADSNTSQMDDLPRGIR